MYVITAGVKVSLLHTKNSLEIYCQKETQKSETTGLYVAVKHDPSTLKTQETIKSFLKPHSKTDTDIHSAAAGTDLSSTESSNSSQYGNSMSTCPICGVNLSTNNLVLNQHIDECLNKPTIESVIKESYSTNAPSLREPQVRTTKSSKKRQRTLATYFVAEDEGKSMRHLNS